MRFKSIKNKLLIAVSVLVICTGLLISLLVSQQYNKNLRETLETQAENIAHAIALEATEKILINDLIGLQKMLDHHIRSHPGTSYLFVLRDGVVLAHTFQNGFPLGLIKVHKPPSWDRMHIQKVVSTHHDHYLDIAFPIFEGKAGILRLGLSEKPYREKVTRLWAEMTWLTLGILLLALMGTILFIKRITKPLLALAHATREVEKGMTNVRVEIEGGDEIGQLASSFNHMVERMEEYTGKLEEQTVELERAYNQTRTFCSIVQEIGGFRHLSEIGPFLIRRFQEIVKCSDNMLLLFFNSNRTLVFAISEEKIRLIEEAELVQKFASQLITIQKRTFLNKPDLVSPLISENFEGINRFAVIPIHGERDLFGAALIGCPTECKCDLEEVDTVDLILNQSTGVIRRAIFEEEKMRELQGRLWASAEFSGIVGKDPKMQLIYRLIEDTAPTDATVLIQGESGTGKELVAQAIHLRSARKQKPFVVINCSAYPPTLLESELFGHEKGAFTGAIRQKAGRFELAIGGTVFLDEIGEIPPSAQIRLLRVLQNRKFERLGGEKTLNADVRIISATNKDLLKEVKEGRFREDLFYRLNVIPVHMPPLRERRNDIPILARHFLHRFATEQGKQIEGFSPQAMRLMLDYSWPGNVRELENSIEHATVLSKDHQIDAMDLPVSLQETGSLSNGKSQSPSIMLQERALLQEVLDECGWNKKEAARHLGISRNTLYVKLKKYQLIRPTTH